MKPSYCVFCKKKTGNKKIKIETIKGRSVQKSLCSVCGHKKTTFLPSKQRGKGIVDKFISALPVELHMLGTDETDKKTKRTSFCGPGTKLNKRLGSNDVPHDWSKPINDLDRACYKHDIAYRDNKDNSSRNAADNVLSAAAKRFEGKPGISLLDKTDAKIVQKAMSLIKRKA